MVTTLTEKPETLNPTVLGTLMSIHYLTLDTTTRVSQLAQTTSSVTHLLRMLAQCKEVQHPLRRNEKSILNQINGGKVRFKVKGIAIKNVVNSEEMKSNILIQAGIGRTPIQDDSLCVEMLESMEASERILR
uniref:SEC63 domain-containing protein n=1 Tax=Globisporangium ultimum (strain ATCC 200006 / CBS 805.95 / DAOM BR144) TaxID=431595 RepID=K3WRG3_GLOUD